MRCFHPWSAGWRTGGDRVGNSPERELFQVLNMDSAQEVPPLCGKITLDPSVNLRRPKRLLLLEYAEQFARMKDELADVEFAVDELITAPEQVDALADRIAACDESSRCT